MASRLAWSRGTAHCRVTVTTDFSISVYVADQLWLSIATDEASFAATCNGLYFSSVPHKKSETITAVD